MIDHRSTIYTKNLNYTIGTYLTECDMWWKSDMTTIWPIVPKQSMPKVKLNCHDWIDWMHFVMKTRHNNDMIVHINKSMPRMKLSCCYRLDRVKFFMKTRHNNVVTNHIRTVYAKNEIELSWPIELGLVCYQNQIGEQHEWTYRCDLHQKRN